MKIETVLEQALHLEAVSRKEDEEQAPKSAVLRTDETKSLVETVTKLVNKQSDKQYESLKNQSREQRNSRDGGATTDLTMENLRDDRGKQQDRRFSERHRIPPPGPSH